MKPIQTLLTSLLALMLLIPAEVYAQTGDDDKLFIGGSYFFDETLLNRFAEYLSQELEQDVQVTLYNKTSSLHEDMQAHNVDIMLMNAYSYVLGHEKNPAYKAFAALGVSGNPDSYKSCIITQPDSRLKSLDDIIDQAADTDFRFVHATSTSGHIVPRYAMHENGLPQAEGKFKSLKFAGSHKDAIMQVINNEVTAAACGKPSLEYLVEQGEIDESQYRIIWTSHDIPGAPVVFNTKLPESMQRKIRRAFVQLHQNDPELMDFTRETFHAGSESRFIKVSDGLYNAIRDVASNMDELILFLNFYLK